jgi:hypothetical protein
VAPHKYLSQGNNGIYSDFTDGESEFVSGFNTEYGGSGFAPNLYLREDVDEKKTLRRHALRVAERDICNGCSGSGIALPSFHLSLCYSQPVVKFNLLRASDSLCITYAPIPVSGLRQ